MTEAKKDSDVEPRSSNGGTIYKEVELPLEKLPRKLGCLICCLFPLFATLISAVFSIPLVAFAGWESQEAFFTVLLEVSNANGHVLHQNQDIDEEVVPDVFLAKLIIIFAGFISLGSFACFLGFFSAGPIERPIIGKAMDTLFPKNIQRKRLSDVVNTPNVNLDDMQEDYEYYNTTLEMEEKWVDEFQCFIFFYIILALPLLVSVISLLFGGILALAEDSWSMNDGFWMIFGELLDMQIDLVEPDPIESMTGKLVLCFISFWSLAFFALLLAMLSGPVLVIGVKKMQNQILQVRRAMRNGSYDWSEYNFHLICTIFVYVPLLTGCVAIVLGLLLAAFGGYHAGEAISEVLAELLNMQIQLGDLDAKRGFNKIIMVIVGIVGLVYFALILGLMSIYFVPPIIVKLNMNPDYTEKHVVRHSLFKLAGFIVFVVPVVAVILSLIFGSILFSLEKVVSNEEEKELWTFELGFFIVFSELLDIQLEFYNIPEINHGFSKFVIALVGCYSFVFFALITAVISGPIMLPIVHYYTNTTPFIEESRIKQAGKLDIKAMDEAQV